MNGHPSFWARHGPRATNPGRSPTAVPGIMTDVSQVDPAAEDQSESPDADERAWLEERLHEYRELLAYLDDH